MAMTDMPSDITMYSFEERSHGHGIAYANILYLLLARMEAFVFWPYGESFCPYRLGSWWLRWKERE